MDIGNRIKTLRVRNNLTLEELASRCELTKGFLSQVERNLTSPSINTLKDLCEVLGVSLSTFFAEENQQKQIFTENDFFVDQKDQCIITWVIPDAQSRSREPILVSLLENGKSPVLEPHEGEEFGFVINGKITLVVDGKKQVIKKGQSFYLNGESEHYFINESKHLAEYLWVSNPPLF